MNNKKTEENFFEGEYAIIYGNIGGQKVKVEIPDIKDFYFKAYFPEGFSTNQFIRKPCQGISSFLAFPDQDGTLFTMTEINKKES